MQVDHDRCVAEEGELDSAEVQCRVVYSWYCQWSDPARKAFLDGLLKTVTPPDPLASLMGDLGVDVMAGMPRSPIDQLQWAETEEEQVRVATMWSEGWPDGVKNDLLNELECLDQANIYAFYERYSRLRWR